MLRVIKRLAPSIKILMRGRVIAVMDYFMSFMNWQSLLKEITHLIGLISICLFNVTVSFMEHVIVVGFVFVVRMWCCDGMLCVLRLEVSLFVSVTNSVSLDIVLFRFRMSSLKHACKVR